MYGPHGRENLDFRLLHVYYSDKRATNKGVSQEEIAAEKAKRALDDASVGTGSTGSGSTNNTKKRRKATYMAEQRAIRSSWQQPSRHYHREMPHPPPPSHYYPHRYPMNYRPPPGPGYSVGYDFPNPIPMPSSEWRHDDRKQSARPSFPPSNVSPSGESSAKQQDLLRAYSNNANMFDTLPLASFDDGDVDATVTALTRHGSGGFRSAEKSSVFRPRNSTEESGRRHSREDSQAQIAHLLDEDNFESSLMDLEQAWKSDPELQMNMTFSRDEGDRARSVPPTDESADLLSLKLEGLHDQIRRGIFGYPEHERPALVSIVAEWARCIARSPLDPFPVLAPGRQVPPQRQPASAPVAAAHHGYQAHQRPIKTEQYDSSTAAV